MQAQKISPIWYWVSPIWSDLVIRVTARCVSHRATGLRAYVPQGRLYVESRPHRIWPCGPVRLCGPVPFAVTAHERSRNDIRH